MLLDVGADSAANPLTRLLYVATARLATHSSYRDASSAAVMARAGEPGAIAPDLAFAHPAPTLANPESGRVVVGVMAYDGRGGDAKRGENVRRRYIATIADALAEVVKAGNHVVLVGGDRVDGDVAREVASAVRMSCPSLSDDQVVVREPTTFATLTDEMSHADVVIASRFHNLICALRLGRPTVSVGYAGKSRNLMEAVGADGYCQKIDQLDSRTLVAQVETARRDADALSARIQHATSQYAHQVNALLERVAIEDLGLTPRAREGLNIAIDRCAD